MPSSSSHIGAAPVAARVLDLLPPLAALAAHVLRSRADFPVHVGSVAPVRQAASQEVIVRADAADAGAGANALGAVGPITSARLMHAVQRGDIAEVAMLLQARVPVDAVNRDGYTALALAARSGRADIATALLEAHANPDAAGLEGVTPLMLAANGGFVAVTRVLAAHGANIEAVNPAGYTALMVAMHSNRLQSVTALLASGANPNALTPLGHPLQMAAERGWSDIVSALVKFGANLHPDGTALVPALMAAAVNGHLNVVAVLARTAGVDIDANLRFAAANGMANAVVALLGAGADPNALDNDSGYTALSAAALSGHIAVVNLLVRAGADIDTDFLRAAESGSVEMTIALVKAGANPNATNAAGFTAFMLAAKNGHVAVVTALKHAGVDIDVYLFFAAEQGAAPMVAFLARAGGDVNVADADGVTALMRAARNGDIDVVNALVQAGADVDGSLPMAEHNGNAGTAPGLIRLQVGADIVVVNGFTALMLAALYGHPAVVAALRNAGADMDTDLFLAADAGMVRIVAALVRAGADVNVADDVGITALMGAAIGGHIDVVNLLIQAGAQVQERLPMAERQGNAGAAEGSIQVQMEAGTVAVNGFTALMLAALHGHPAVVALLRHAGADIDGDLHVAVSQGNVPVVQALVRAGANIEAAEAAARTALAAQGEEAPLGSALPAGGPQVHAIDGSEAAAAVPGNAPLLHPLADAPAASSLDAWSMGGAVDPMNNWNTTDEAHQAAASHACFLYALAQEDLPASPSQHVPAAATARPGEALGQVSFAMDMDHDPLHAAAAPAVGDGDANVPIGCVDPASSMGIELVGLFQPT
ncbi:MAG: ankyrin repeat domain-containing protein [Comamonas sp.]